MVRSLAISFTALLHIDLVVVPHLFHKRQVKCTFKCKPALSLTQGRQGKSYPSADLDVPHQHSSLGTSVSFRFLKVNRKPMCPQHFVLQHRDTVPCFRPRRTGFLCTPGTQQPSTRVTVWLGLRDSGRFLALCCKGPRTPHARSTSSC